MTDCKTLTLEDWKFIRKLGRRSDNIFLNMQSAYRKNILSLDDKKRCCLLANGFTLGDFDKEYKFVVPNDKTVIMKKQWFHSALCVYMLLTNPEAMTVCPDNLFIKTIQCAKAQRTFLNVARDVLSSDPDGGNVITTLDSKPKISIAGDQISVSDTKV